MSVRRGTRALLNGVDEFVREHALSMRAPEGVFAGAKHYVRSVGERAGLVLPCEFVRGWDDARGVDSGRVFGSAQTDLLRNHTHDYQAPSISASMTTGTSAKAITTRLRYGPSAR